MREIKFKIAVKSPDFDNPGSRNKWFVSTNSFTIGEFWDRNVELHFKDGSTLAFGDVDWETDEVIYLQYTGLKDKSSAEIYEGDIVKAKWQDQDYVEGESISVVEYERAGFILSNDNIHGLDDDQLEVIGNVYENPELLK